MRILPVLRTRAGRRHDRADQQRWRGRIRHRPTVYQPPRQHRRHPLANPVLVPVGVVMAAWLLLANLVRAAVGWWSP